MVQYQQTQREHAHIDHAPQSDGLTDLDVAPDGQGDIDQQGEVSHTDAEDMLDHGADTVEARGGELVGEHEKLVIHRCHQGDAGDDQICPDLLHPTHNKLLNDGKDRCQKQTFSAS